MIKNLIKHSSIYSIGELSKIAIAFLLLPIYTRFLIPEEYGILELITILGSIFSIFFSLSMYSGFQKTYLYDSNTKKEKKEALSTALMFVITNSVIMFSIAFLFSKDITLLIFGDIGNQYFVKLVFLVTLFQTFTVIPQSFMIAENKSKLFVIISLIQTIINMSLNIFFVAYLKKGIEGILFGNLITMALIGSVLTIWLFNKAGFVVNLKWLKTMLSFSFPMVFSYLASFILTMSDRFILNMFSSLTQLGLYGLGYKIGMILNIAIVSPFMGAYSPFCFTIAKEKGHKEIFSRVFLYTAIVMTIAALSLALFSKDILRIATTPEYFEAYKVVIYVTLSYAIYCTTAVLASGINITGKTIYASLTVILAAIINIILNFILIPKYGMIGAAIATLISYFMQWVFIYTFSQRLYNIPYPIFKVLFLFISSFFIYVVGESLLNYNVFINAILCLLAISLYICICYLFLDGQMKEKTRTILISIFIHKNIGFKYRDVLDFFR